MMWFWTIEQILNRPIHIYKNSLIFKYNKFVSRDNRSNFSSSANCATINRCFFINEIQFVLLLTQWFLRNQRQGCCLATFSMNHFNKRLHGLINRRDDVTIKSTFVLINLVIWIMERQTQFYLPTVLERVILKYSKLLVYSFSHDLADRGTVYKKHHYKDMFANNWIDND